MPERTDGWKNSILQDPSDYRRRSNKAQGIFVGQPFPTTINRHGMFDMILNTTRVYPEIYSQFISNNIKPNNI